MYSILWDLLYSTSYWCCAYGGTSGLSDDVRKCQVSTLCQDHQHFYFSATFMLWKSVKSHNRACFMTLVQKCLRKINTYRNWHFQFVSKQPHSSTLCWLPLKKFRGVFEWDGLLVCQLLCKVFIIWSIFCPGVAYRWQQLLIDNFVGYDTILMNSLLSASGRGISHSMLQGFHSFVKKSWCNCNKT